MKRAPRSAIACLFGTACAGGPVAMDATADGGIDARLAPAMDAETSRDAATDVVSDRVRTHPDALGDADTTGTRDATVSDAAVRRVGLRVVNVAARSGSLDLCLVPRDGGPRTAPVVASLGRAEGLAFAQSSALATVAPGEYDLAVVPAGTTDCTSASVTLAPLSLAPGAAPVTVVIATSPLGVPTLVTFADDPAPVPASASRLRIADLSTGTDPLDVGSLSGIVSTDFELVPGAHALAFGDVTAPVLVPVGARALAARRVGTVPGPGRYLFATPVAFASGHSHVAYVTGRGGDLDHPLAALVCDDTRAPVAHLASCVFGPARASVRLAHLANDSGTVDVCFRYGNAPIDSTPVGPLLAAGGFAGGLAYPALSRRVPIAAGVPISLLVVDAAPGDCTHPLLEAPVVLDDRADLTLAFVGRRTGSPTVTATLLTDTVVPDADFARVRFVNAVTSLARVDLVVDGTALFPSVAFGTAGNGPQVDANGYAPLAPSMPSVTARRTSDASRGLASATVPLRPTTLTTIFAIGDAAGTGTSAAALYVCDEGGGYDGARVRCATVVGAGQ